MSNFGSRKGLSNSEDVDEDELLATLTNEELQELEEEMAAIDPDENTPIRLRQRDQTAKQPTGSFSREALLRHWQNETNKLLEKNRPGIGPSQMSMDESQTDKSEEECLSENDSEPSLRTLSPLNSTEVEEAQTRRHGNSKDVNYNQTFIKASHTGSKNTDSKGHCRDKRSGARRDVCYEAGSNLNVMPERPSRISIDIDGILEKILKNDESVSEVNLNNTENISQEMLISFAEALSSNTHVRAFSLANTHADDQVAFALANLIKKNDCITSLNVESNFISGRGILALVRSLQQNASLVELRFHNQRHICGGQVEMEMVNLLRDNTTLLKLGYHFDLPGPRMSATTILTRNQDRQRQTRVQLQRQNQKSEETMVQATHTLKNGPTSKAQNIPDNRLVTSSQWQKHNSLPKAKPHLPLFQSENNTTTRKIAEMVKLQDEATADKQGQNKQNTKYESGHLFKDAKHALKPPPKKKQDGNSQ